MITSALLAYLHFLAAFGVFFSIIFEKLTFKQELNKQQAILLRKIDGIYGLSSILVIVFGFIRVFYFEKGSDFYFSNSFFLLKLTLFVIIGLLSIYPTVVFYKWRKLEPDEFPIRLNHTQFNRINRILTFELILILLLLLTASLMAKGIGF